MTQITLRGISPELEKYIKKEADKKCLSINKVVLSLLETIHAHTAQKIAPKKKYHDLDHFAGVWSEEEAKEFEDFLKQQRHIDMDMWK